MKSLKTEEKLDIALNKYGNSSLAYSIKQPDLNYFFYKDGVIAYKKSSIFYAIRHVAVLGDPICNVKDKQIILKKFISKYKHIYFVQISKSTKFYLKDLNFKCLPFGQEHIIEVNKMNLKWKKKTIKKSINWSIRNKYKFKEITNNNPFFLKKFHQLNMKWNEKKIFTHKDHTFLNRKFSPKETQVRYFILEKDNQFANIMRCDPVYNNNILKGYSISLTIHNPSIKHNLSYYLISNIVNYLKKENIETISLGVSPFSKNNKTHKIYDIIFQKSMFKLGSFFYNFANLEKFKKSISTTQKETYFASKKKFPLLEILHAYCITTGLEKNVFTKHKNLTNKRA